MRIGQRGDQAVEVVQPNVTVTEVRGKIRMRSPTWRTQDRGWSVPEATCRASDGTVMVGTRLIVRKVISASTSLDHALARPDPSSGYMDWQEEEVQEVRMVHAVADWHYVAVGCRHWVVDRPSAWRV